ncbi:MAG: TrmH family RNA methyltransferase [bacterium]|nr:TrmH family RNA methyltransferase [bacterium]
MKTVSMRDVRILLHDIRSVYNTGAIFRTADAIGASHIYLTGYTPTPVDRFGKHRTDFAKCALGSENTLPWEAKKSPAALMKKLKSEGFQIVCVEQSPTSIDYKKFKPGKKTLVVFGNEVDGVPSTNLAKADIVAEIPMRGMKESLNVSVSAGIVLFRWFD